MSTLVKHHASYVPKLSIEERDRRWDELRKYMAIQGMSCMVLVGSSFHGMADFKYITHTGNKLGFTIFGIFQLVGDPVVWLDHTHQHVPTSRWLYAQDWVTDIRPNFGPPEVVKFLKEKKYDRSKIGIVGCSDMIMQGSFINYLEKELPDAVFMDTSPMVRYLQMYKSPEEINFLKKAGEIAHKTIETFVETAEPGKKECEVYADMIRAQIANGAIPEAGFLLTSGPMDGMEENKHLLHGDHEPTVPTTRTLQKGDLIIFEFHTIYGGYFVAAEFSLYLGEAPEPLKKIHAVSAECAQRLLEAIKPGVTIKEALDAEREPCLREKMDYVELGFHHHGLCSGGPLSVVWKPSPDFKIGELKFKENMVFGTNIDIHDPNWRNDVGLMLGDTFQVTKDGACYLVNTPLDIIEKRC